MARMTDEWIAKTDNEAIPPRVKLRVFEKHKGQCAQCTRKLRPGYYAFDHIVALINGGTHSESNLQPLCSSPCHYRKTKRDMAEKSKSAGIRKREAGIKKPRTITRWRRFSGEIVTATRER